MTMNEQTFELLKTMLEGLDAKVDKVDEKVTQGFSGVNGRVGKVEAEQNKIRGALVVLSIVVLPAVAYLAVKLIELI